MVQQFDEFGRKKLLEEHWNQLYKAYLDCLKYGVNIFMNVIAAIFESS
jgi:hypothetical protein